MALDFRLNPVPDDVSRAAFGTLVAAAMPNKRLLILEVRYDGSDAYRKWDVARALSALPR